MSAERLRVGINARHLGGATPEGLGRVTLEVSRRLARDHPGAAVVPFVDRPCDPSLFAAADRLTPVVLRPPAGHPLLTAAWSELTLVPALRRHRIDVLLSVDGATPLRAGPPSVPIVHDLGFEHFPDHLDPLKRWYWRLYLRRAVRRAPRVVAISAFTRDDLVATYGLPAERIDVVPLGIDAGLRPLRAAERQRVRAAHSGGAPYFLHVGAIQPRKNVATLLRAFDRFKARSASAAKLLLAGRLAWRYDDVLRAHAAMRHRDDVRLLGYLPRPALAEVIGAAQALVSVSHYEGFGLPLAEAMACGVPVVGAARAAVPEVIGDAGLLVDPLDVEAIAAALHQLDGDSPARRAAIDRGLQRARRFDWDRTAAGIWNALARATRASRPGA